MKRFLIVVTVLFVFVCMVRGSEGPPVQPSGEELINQMVDDALGRILEDLNSQH